MTFLPWLGSTALQRARAMHPAAGTRTALRSPAGPRMSPALAIEEVDRLDGTGNLDRWGDSDEAGAAAARSALLEGEVRS
jgi:hypothetical protein